MKYEKPSAQDLSEISVAEGLCLSGQAVGTCFNTFGVAAGLCTTGLTAGADCSAGGTPVDTCNYGNFGFFHGNCTRGGIAKGG